MQTQKLPWTLQINDTLERTIAMVSERELGPGDASQFEAARTEILAQLAKRPGPNAHVDAHGKGEGEPTIFVGIGDPYAKYLGSPPPDRYLRSTEPLPKGAGLAPAVPLAVESKELDTAKKPRKDKKSKPPETVAAAKDLGDEHVRESIREGDKAAHLRPGL